MAARVLKNTRVGRELVQTFLVTIRRGKDGHVGVLSTISLEFAVALKALLEEHAVDYQAEIKTFTAQKLDSKD
jgi:hypothetical protein